MVALDRCLLCGRTREVFAAVDPGHRAYVGQECHPGADPGSGDAAAADGEPPGHQDPV